MRKVKCMLLRLNLDREINSSYGKMIQIFHFDRKIWPNNKDVVIANESKIKLDSSLEVEMNSPVYLELWQSDHASRSLLGTIILNPTSVGGPFVGAFKNQSNSHEIYSIEWGVARL